MQADLKIPPLWLIVARSCSVLLYFVANICLLLQAIASAVDCCDGGQINW
jgi:hypothetical protein